MLAIPFRPLMFEYLSSSYNSTDITVILCVENGA